MPVSPINVGRVSQNLRTTLLGDSIRLSQLEMFLAQRRIATGRAFVSPSEDPVAAARSLQLDQTLSQQSQLVRNLRSADNTLSAADSALSEINGLLIEAQGIASQNIGSLTSAAERDAGAALIASIRGQLQSVGNRTFYGRYLFAGQATTTRPFIDVLGGIAYVGDTSPLLARIDASTTAEISVPGNVLYSSLSASVVGWFDLSPNLTESTRLDDLAGAIGLGIRLGQLVFNEPTGAGVFTVDLAEANTIGDVVDLINAAAATVGSAVTASLAETGLVIAPGGSDLAISDTGTGVVASDLGILTSGPISAPIIGDDLGARLTQLTPVAAITSGAGIDMTSGLVITNGSKTATVDISDAATMQDIINRINNADVFVLARINDDRTGIDLFNRVSGTSLSVAENGGTTATDLGIRTMDSSTPLDRLNNGLGVGIVEGDADLSIETMNGSVLDVVLDGAETIGDVIDLINTTASEAGVAITASFTDEGNGIHISDSTGGNGTLRVSNANLSSAAGDLGLVQVAGDGQSSLIGEDVNPARTEGILDALLQLEDALRRDDTQGISIASGRLDTLTQEVTRVHGIIGARSQSMRAGLEQMRDAGITTEIFLSEVRDLDFVKAVTQLQAAQFQVQATMQTGAQLLSLSLLDFLR